MANEEHVALLKQGKDVWNNWRKEHPEIRPDLSGEDLGVKNYLSIPNMNEYDLHEANLRRVILDDAQLQKANLIEADLSGARLLGTNLLEANMTKADLRGANLTDTYLLFSILYKANLRGTTLNRTQFSNTTMPDGSTVTDTDLVDEKFPEWRNQPD